MKKWSDFAMDVHKGFEGQSKSLSSKYFYDERGDALFAKIMEMPEYYLSRAEMEILREQGKEIAAAVCRQNECLDIYELGPGNGRKSWTFLSFFPPSQIKYVPVDISETGVCLLAKKTREKFPELQVKERRADFFHTLDFLEQGKRKLLLFLGSTLGNMWDAEAKILLSRLSSAVDVGDFLLLGLDLKKSAEIVFPAYNDAQGYTRDFNLNLLRRINEELGADFDLHQFRHVPLYKEAEGIAYSYLESKCDQTVYVAETDGHYVFEKGEKIHTEISRKYDEQLLKELLRGSDWEIIGAYRDHQDLFCDFLLQKKQASCTA